jgi:hypothetical protein
MKPIRLLLILAALCLGGCATLHPVRVLPWQRAALADYTMDPNRDPLGKQMSEHVSFSREAASGGGGVGGSGCGCN